MKTINLNFTPKLFRYALLAIAATYIVVYLILVFFRLQYPFELEWQEGGMVDHVRRILSGQKLYVSPSLEFVPFIYTPLYFYISALVSGIIGIGFLPLRLVSFVSSLGCFFLIFLIVERETKSKFSGFLASCLLAGTFRVSGAWFDVARVDSLFLFFLLAALYLIRFKASSKSLVLAGVFISLSFLTKQTALLVSLPVMLYCIYLNQRRSVLFVATVVAIIGISTLLLNHVHEGWYTYYIFNLPRQHPLEKSMFASFWMKDLLSPLSIACVMAIFYLFILPSNSTKNVYLFYFCITIGVLGSTWASRLHRGGYENVLLPAYAVISMLFGLATHTALGFVRRAHPAKRRLLEVLTYFVCILQFACLTYNPRRQLPTRDDMEAGRKFVQAMAEMKEEVFVPYHGFLPALAGKNTYAHAMALYDVWKGDEEQVKGKLTDELRQAIREKRFGTIILDSGQFLKDWFEKTDFEGYCMKEQSFFENKSVFWPVTGMATRPQIIIYKCSKEQ